MSLLHRPLNLSITIAGGCLAVLIVTTLAVRAGSQSNGADSRATVPADSRVRVSRNVHVSAQHADWFHGETWLSAHPEDPNILVGASMFREPDAWEDGAVAYMSRDGGRSWQATLRTSSTERGTDPVTTIGHDGTAYFVHLRSDTGFAQVPHKRAVLVYRSTDGGEHWLSPPSELFTTVDREAASVESKCESRPCRLYVYGTGIPNAATDSVVMFTSADQGRTFGEPQRAISTEHRGLLVGRAGALADGTLLVPFADLAGPPDERGTRRYTLRVARYMRDGRLMGSPIAVQPALALHRSAQVWPTLAIDQTHGPFDDRAYITWIDGASGRDQILLASSTDHGDTWSAPVVVSDAPERFDTTVAGPHHAQPNVAVNRDGVVGVMWQDRRAYTDNYSFDIRFAASLDGGTTFGPSVQVSEHGFVHSVSQQVLLDSNGWQTGRTLAVWANFGGFSRHAGHTTGFAATADGRFHPFWIDNRTGIPQVWTAAVTVAGTAASPWPRQNVLDVTESLAMKLTAPVVDREQRTVSVNVRLKNIGHDTFGPILLGLRAARSDYGWVRPVNQRFGPPSNGAMWTVDEAELAPGQISAPVHLVFSLPAASTLLPLFGPSHEFKVLDLQFAGYVEARPRAREDRPRPGRPVP